MFSKHVQMQSNLWHPCQESTRKSPSNATLVGSLVQAVPKMASAAKGTLRAWAQGVTGVTSAPLPCEAFPTKGASRFDYRHD